MRKITRNVAVTGLFITGLALMAPLSAFAADNSDLTVTAVVAGTEADSSGGCTPTAQVSLVTDAGGIFYEGPVSTSASGDTSNNAWQWIDSNTTVTWTTDSGNCAVENGGAGPATAPLASLVASRSEVTYAATDIATPVSVENTFAGALADGIPAATASLWGIDVTQPSVAHASTLEGGDSDLSQGTFTARPRIYVFSSGTSPIAGIYSTTFNFSVSLH
jgi:hypothetical protein